MIKKIVHLVIFVLMAVCAYYWIDKGNKLWTVYCILVGIANGALLFSRKENKADK